MLKKRNRIIGELTFSMPCTYKDLIVRACFTFIIKILRTVLSDVHTATHFCMLPIMLRCLYLLIYMIVSPN